MRICQDGSSLHSAKHNMPPATASITSYIAIGALSVCSKEPRPGIVGHTDDGDWIQYDQIDFGKGVSSVAVELAMGPKDAKVEFHLDEPNGPLIATLIPMSTGNWTDFQIQKTPVQGATGVHNLFLTFHGERGLPDIRSIQFQTD